MAFAFTLPRVAVGDGIDNFAGAKLSFFEFGTSTPKTTFSDVALSSANTDPVVADADGLFGPIFTDTQGTYSLTTSTDVPVITLENFFAPEDGITSLAAANVDVTDAAGNFTTDDLESVLTQIASDWARLNRTNTWEADQTFSSANILMADNEIQRPLLKDYAIKHSVVSSSSNVIELDLTDGNSFVTTLTENITTVTLSNPPATGIYGQFVWKIIQDGGGGAFTVTFPVSVLWPGGTAPTITVTNDAIDEVTLRTIDAGTEWRGGFSQAFA